jgi:hypothetical protein
MVNSFSFKLNLCIDLVAVILLWTNKHKQSAISHKLENSIRDGLLLKGSAT